MNEIDLNLETYKLLSAKSFILPIPTFGNVFNKVDSSKEKHEHEYVDLGLSVKWATCNVGASSPEEYGDYYAWGETETKSIYNWSTYKWYKKSKCTLTKYCNERVCGTVDNKTELDLEDDAAYVNWGSGWRMPTHAEMIELQKKCTWTWTNQNGKDGYKVTGPNRNFIFLPAAGWCDSCSRFSVGYKGGYWSSFLNTCIPYGAEHIYFSPHPRGVNTLLCGGRYCGRSVRPVYTKP